MFAAILELVFYSFVNGRRRRRQRPQRQDSTLGSRGGDSFTSVLKEEVSAAAGCGRDEEKSSAAADHPLTPSPSQAAAAALNGHSANGSPYKNGTAVIKPEHGLYYQQTQALLNGGRGQRSAADDEQNAHSQL